MLQNRLNLVHWSPCKIMNEGLKFNKKTNKPKTILANKNYWKFITTLNLLPRNANQQKRKTRWFPLTLLLRNGHFCAIQIHRLYKQNVNEWLPTWDTIILLHSTPVKLYSHENKSISSSRIFLKTETITKKFFFMNYKVLLILVRLEFQSTKTAGGIVHEISCHKWQN